MKHVKPVGLIKANGFDDDDISQEDLSALMQQFFDFVLEVINTKGKGEEVPA